MADRKTFSDSVTALPPKARTKVRNLALEAVDPVQKEATMKLLFSLKMPGDSKNEIMERISRGEVIPSHDFASKYAVDEADADKIVQWLKEQGFKVTFIAPHNAGIYATASIAQIEQSLAVKIVPVTKDGITYPAAENAPSLPADIGSQVRAIVGLQPFHKVTKHYEPATKQKNRSMMAANGSLSPNIANSPPYLVEEILRAYQADGLQQTGEGQTIAILIDTFPDDADLTAFWIANGLPADLTRIEKINVGTTAPLPPSGEETLDAQWTSGIAPGAKIRIYATESLSMVDLTHALDVILQDLPSQPGMRQLSMSLGLGETYLQDMKGIIDAQSERFLRLAAAGVNTFVSSGDGGSHPGAKMNGRPGPLQAQYEASDPAVIAVGGTSLSLAQDGSVAQEIAWPKSGGGKSIFFERPVWQSGHDAPAGSERMVPDVSLVADKLTGGFMVMKGKATVVGGTSWSAPIWAGFCALINQARQQAGKQPLPFLNPLLYTLAGSACFRPIVEGSNGAYQAGPGYSLVTGIGVPNLKALITALTQ